MVRARALARQAIGCSGRAAPFPLEKVLYLPSSSFSIMMGFRTCERGTGRERPSLASKLATQPQACAGRWWLLQ